MRTTALLATAAVAALAGAAHGGDDFVFYANISGDQEVPATPSPALGFLAGVYDATAMSFSFSWLITDNLIGNPAAPGAHIHNAPPGSNGPIVFGFSDGAWALSGDAVWENMTQENVDDLFAGDLYVNFHTDAYPTGEVRGQILLIPSPGVLGLAGMGLLAAARRRR